MKAMVFEEIGKPLVFTEMNSPVPGPHEVRIKVQACGVCRTDLHIIEGDLANPKLPLILGHQVVGTIDELGAGSFKHELGSRVGIPWLGNVCHTCEFCLLGRENLCDKASFTRYSYNGGF